LSVKELSGWSLSIGAISLDVLPLDQAEVEAAVPSVAALERPAMESLRVAASFALSIEAPMEAAPLTISEGLRPSLLEPRLLSVGIRVAAG
jgi:hypothetical protein